MKMAQTVPELGVPDVKAAQAYYRDFLGFEIAWYNEAGEIGAVSNGECVIFFRRSDGNPQAATFWVFADDVDSTFAELTNLGANITVPIADTAWGLRQFTVMDAYGNMFNFHHDL